MRDRSVRGLCLHQTFAYSVNTWLQHQAPVCEYRLRQGHGTLHIIQVLAMGSVPTLPAGIARDRDPHDFLYGTFPEGFAWGTATASYQIEGAHDNDGGYKLYISKAHPWVALLVTN